MERAQNAPTVADIVATRRGRVAFAAHSSPPPAFGRALRAPHSQYVCYASAVAWAYAILPNRRVVYSHMSGTVTMNDFLELRRAVEADSRFDRTYSQLVDFTGGHASLTPDELIALATSSVAAPKCLRALVGPDARTHRLARAYGEFRDSCVESDTTRVFRSLKEACAWLYVSESEVHESVKTTTATANVQASS